MCTCTGERAAASGRRFKANLLPDEVTFALYEGKRHVIVPVVMMKWDVPMNGTLVPQEEFVPESWNGVPVTAGHPEGHDGFMTANSPDALTDWAVGRIFNARLEGTGLHAEAWIDSERAERVAPGMLAALSRGGPIDVSTGFFSRDEEQQGSLGGQEYAVIARDIKPDHLAILLGEEGACSWSDGCGIRSHVARRRGTIMKKLNAKAQTALEALRVNLGLNAKVDIKKPEGVRQVINALLGNERGDDENRTQMIADLISNEGSPFLPEDEDSLRMMSDGTLRKMRDTYAAANADGEGEEEEPAANEDGAGETTEEEPVANRNGGRRPAANADVAKMIADGFKAQTTAMKAMVQETVKGAVDALLTPEQRAALALATNHAKAHRETLEAKVVANSAISKEVVSKMDMATLEAVANGILPTPNYSGRAVVTNAIGEGDEPNDRVKAMTAGADFRKGLVTNLSERRKAK